jgi:hypothetical protein
VGASAAAAVTSAVAASFAGVAGTLIGAAIGSIVSTVAGALYADYLSRAGDRIRTTRTVVIQRIPGDVLAATPLRHLTGPADLPAQESMQPIGDETHAEKGSGSSSGNNGLDHNGLDDGSDNRHDVAAETVAVPVSSATELLAKPDGMGVLQVGDSAPGQDGAHGQDGEADQPRPWWRRPAVTMAAVGGAGFLIALGVVTTAEGLIGHPLSGGSSGTTLGHAVGSGGTGTSTKPTVTPTATPSSVTSTSSGTATTGAAVTTTSAATATTAPSATVGPQSTTVAPTSAATGAAPTQAAGTDSQTSTQALGVVPPTP